jgi:hypothetical protein
MTREDFDNRIRGGEKLLILDDMVLNVESFKADHPGGQFLIDFHIGRDISKFFYGGYVLENQSGMAPYTHSNLARSIVNSLAVAKLIAPSETLQGQITSSQEINKSTKVFTLQITAPSEANFRVPASTSVETIGKHYLFRSINNPQVRRHYTVSSCMKPDTYKEYLNAINQFKNKAAQISFNDRVLVENSGSNEIIFTAKNYNIVGGLSQLMHTAGQNERYEVKALLGKGLNLQKDGVHVAFTGGTGILVFVDLVALLIR